MKLIWLIALFPFLFLACDDAQNDIIQNNELMNTKVKLLSPDNQPVKVSAIILAVHLII
ncbi:hypothetical protein K9M79_03745 [Candidatus Woesearchaeota archaeon]|nr:hypothetical protein [Candidatus Woesearchaeota archaeon]